MDLMMNWWTPNFGKKKHAPGRRIRRPCLSLLHGLSPATQTHGEGALHQSDLVVQRQIRHVERPWWTMDFSRDFQWKTMDFPSFQWIFQWFSNELWIFQWKLVIVQWFSNDFQGKIWTRNHGFSHEMGADSCRFYPPIHWTMIVNKMVS